MGFLNKIKVGDTTYDISAKVGEALKIDEDGTIQLNIGHGLFINDGLKKLQTYNLGDGLGYDQDNVAMKVKLGDGFKFNEKGAIEFNLGSGLVINDSHLNIALGDGLKHVNETIAIDDKINDACNVYLGKTTITGDSSPESFNLNNFTSEGVAKFHVQSRTQESSVDNMPIANRGGGHTVCGELTVLDASLNPSETMITQKLLLSNRVGDSKEYIRSCKEGTWTPWLTTVNMQEVNQTASFDDYIDNGIYSGVYVGEPTLLGQGQNIETYETFVIVTINNYAVHQASSAIPHLISQFKYALTPTGEVTFLKRVGRKTEQSMSWGNWGLLYT